jgi:flavin-binding protein dodecin
MPVAKIIEISCESRKSFEDAIQDGIAKASKTVHNIKSAWVKEQHAVIENGKNHHVSRGPEGDIRLGLTKSAPFCSSRKLNLRSHCVTTFLTSLGGKNRKD